MLDLQARVHLQEIAPGVVAGPVDQELDRAGVLVAGMVRHVDCRRGEAGAQARRQAGRGRLLDHLLVAPLDGAVALAEPDDGSVPVGHHLHLDVPRPLEAPLDVQRAVAGRGQRLAPRPCDALVERVFVPNRHHALAAAAGRGLQDQREAGPSRHRGNPGLGLIVRLAAGYHRDPGAGGRAPRVDLRAEAHNHVRRRADERQPRVHARRRQRGVLGEKAIAGMDRVRATGAGGIDDAPDRQVALGRRRRADVHGVVRRRNVTGGAVGIREDGYGRDAERAAGARDADGDLSAVGDEHPREHGPYIRNTPYAGSSSGARQATDRPSASASRVSAGVRMPSSHRRAVA